MPDIRAFRGIFYNPERIKDLSKVVTEPYDVISSREQAAYYKRHPNNIIRLILGKQYPGDNSKDNQYTRAKRYLADWIKLDILRRDSQANIYIYTQSFSHNARKRTRTGFVVLLKLADFSANTVLPHENTFSYAVEDRLKLLQLTGANLSPVFALFSDPGAKASRLLSQYKKTRSAYIAIEKDGVLHRLWRMGDQAKIAELRRLLKDRQIFIADGHHRYEAALNCKKFNYVMVYLVATSTSGLTILPTHRLLKIKGGLRVPRIIRDLKKVFVVQRFTAPSALLQYMRQRRPARRIFGVYFGRNRFYGLRLKPRSSLTKDLDVNILHNVIIERIFNIVPLKKDIYYTRDMQEAITRVNSGRYQVAFFLQPATVAQVKRVAFAGQKMPHKSTYFYPKALTGLVINKFKV